MRNTLIILIWYIFFNCGVILLKKMFHISVNSRWRWSGNKSVNIFFICWTFLLVSIGFRGILNFPDTLLGILISIEIWQWVEQYRNHKEERIYFLNGWSILTLILFYIFISIFFR